MTARSRTAIHDQVRCAVQLRHSTALGRVARLHCTEHDAEEEGWAAGSGVGDTVLGQTARNFDLCSSAATRRSTRHRVGNTSQCEASGPLRPLGSVAVQWGGGNTEGVGVCLLASCTHHEAGTAGPGTELDDRTNSAGGWASKHDACGLGKDPVRTHAERGTTALGGS